MNVFAEGVHKMLYVVLLCCVQILTEWFIVKYVGHIN